MDTSNKYIEMCKKAIEIQELWKNEEGDWIYSPTELMFLDGHIHKLGVMLTKGGETHDHYHIHDGYDGFDNIEPEDIVWLPRQDQLQPMVFNGGKPIDNLNRIKGMFWNEGLKFDSYEQLWLAFVMKSLHKKLWDDDKHDWEEI